MMWDGELRHPHANLHSITWERRFFWWPHLCNKSNKVLWFCYGWEGEGMASHFLIVLDYYLSEEQYIINVLKGTLNDGKVLRFRDRFRRSS